MEDSGLDTVWLSSLLQSQFFGPCSDHQELFKNEKNLFSIDCILEFCIHCEAQSQHRSLRIFRCSYQDVVRVEEIKKFLDCSQIQTNKVNGEKAVHLKSRPQANDAKPSTKSKTGPTCEACGRYFHNSTNRFCSIKCKASAVDVNPKDQSDQMELPIQELPDLSHKDNQNSQVSTEEKQSTLASTDVSVSEETSKSLRKRSRKGNPSRAPFF